MDRKPLAKTFANHFFPGLLLVGSLALTGCTADFAGTSSGLGGGTASAGVKVGGLVHGGQQPVFGSTVQLWAVGNSGYGSKATAVGTAIKTDVNGGFTYGTYTCPANAYIYITAAGGNPQTGTGSTNNSAIALMAALGPCANLTASTFIELNEVTTVAAVWAMKPFAATTAGTALVNSSITAPSDTFGTSSTNLQGIANAMNVAQVLASTAAGSSPGSNTTGNVSNVEYWQVNALANILALCINTTGVGGTSCSPVVAGTTPSGGTAPADTLQMAIYLAQNPTLSLGLLADINSTAPFQPYSSAVNDWTIGYSIPTGTADSRWIAFDAYGNAWVATGGANALELSPEGDILATPTAYTLAGGTSATTIGSSYEVAVDTASNAWFTDNSKLAIFEVTGSTSAGGKDAGVATGVTTTGVSTTAAVQSIAVDGTNNVWATITGKNIVGVLSGSTLLTTGGPVTTSPFGMAIDLSNQSTSPNYTMSGGHSFIYALDSGGCASLTSVNGGTNNGTGGSIAMDFTGATTIGTTTYAAGAATPLNYIVDSSCNNTTNVPVSGTVVTNTSTANTNNHVFMSTPYGIAFDHSNDMWVVSQNYTQVATDSTTTDKFSLSKLTAPNYSTNFTGATVGPTLAFTSIEGGGLASPFYLAMDGAGGAWVANSTLSAGSTGSGTGGLSGFTNAGGALSPITGFYGGTLSTTNGTTTTTTTRSYSSPRGVAVDGSGNVWVANTAATYITVTVGVATPTVTPLATGIKSGTLASLP